MQILIYVSFYELASTNINPVAVLDKNVEDLGILIFFFFLFFLYFVIDYTFTWLLYLFLNYTCVLLMIFFNSIKEINMLRKEINSSWSNHILVTYG